MIHPPLQLRSDARVARAVEEALRSNEATLRDQADLTGIPAPTGQEAERAAEFAGRLEAVAGIPAATDGAGNVIAVREGEDASLAPVVLAAHLDTVFDAAVDTTVRRSGVRLSAPGIADNGRGLAVLLALARCMRAAGLRTRRPVLLAGTVGEEGEGNLLGARHLVEPGGRGAGAAAFVAVDGAGLSAVVHRGVGSRRFRLSVRGPGGHSWMDRTRPNPLHALARAVTRLADLRAEAGEDAAVTAARWAGGHAINALPRQAWVEVDLRAVDERALQRLADGALTAFEEVVESETAAWPGGELAASVEVIGERPAGETPADSAVVAAVVEATRAVGATPLLTASSTDANAAMAVGIPAVAVGGGGVADGAHTPGEWYRDVDGPRGVERLLLAVLALAGVSS